MQLSVAFCTIKKISTGSIPDVDVSWNLSLNLIQVMIVPHVLTEKVLDK